MNNTTGYTSYNEEDLFYQPEYRPDLTYVTDFSEIEEHLPYIKKADVLYMDTETAPKEKYKSEKKAGLDPHKARIRLFQIGFMKKNQPHFCLLDMWKIHNSKELATEIMDTEQIKVFQNAKFDLKMFKGEGIKYSGNFFDTMLAAQMLTAGLPEKGFSLDKLVERYLHIKLSKEKRLSDWSANELSDGQKLYGLKDVEVLIPLRDILRRKIIENRLARVAQIEFDCLYGTTEMEYHGFKINVAKWENIEQMFQTKRQDAEEAIYTFLGNDLNINSPQQLLKALNTTYTDATGIYFMGTGDDALFPYKNELPVVNAIGQYRKYRKYIDDYCKGFLKYVNSVTGRIHPTYWHLKAKTGRFSCSNPSFQNLPKRDTNIFRECVIAEEGNKLCVSDYSQMEIRVMAEISKDRTMIQAYKDNQDLHSLTASFISGKPINEISPKERQSAKAFNFGLIFGMYPDTLKEYALKNYGVEMSLQEANEYRNKYFEAYSGVKDWHARQAKIGKKNKRSFDLAGRVRYWTYPPPTTELYNTPIQSSACSCMKIVLGSLGRKYKDSKDVKIIGSVHDECLIECPEDKAEEIAKILEQEMVKGAEKLIKHIPIVAEASVGDNWGECH